MLKCCSKKKTARCRETTAKRCHSARL